jgi:hypothetical protein
MAHNLTRAAGCAASGLHAKAETATIRDQLIHVPARIARSARQLVMHLPDAWPWEHAWQALFTAAHAPPVDDGADLIHPAHPSPNPGCRRW